MTYDPIDTNDDGVVDADVDNQSVSTDEVRNIADHVVGSTSELESAFNNVSAGETIWIGAPDTPYRTTQWLDIDVDDVAVKFQSKRAEDGNPIITVADGADVGGIRIGNSQSVNGITIRGLGYDGNEANQDDTVKNLDAVRVVSGDDIDIHDIYATRTHPWREHNSGGSAVNVQSACSNVDVENITTYEIGDRSVEFYGATDCTVKNVFSDQGWDRTVSVQGGAKNITVETIHGIGNQEGSIVAVQGDSTGTTWSENITIRDVHGSGVHKTAVGVEGYIRDVLVQQVTGDGGNSSYPGVKIGKDFEVENIRVENVSLNGYGLPGVKIYQNAHDVNVSGVVSDACSKGLQVDTGATDISVEDFSARNSENAGFEVDADGVALNGCMAKQSNSYGYYLKGADYRVIGCEAKNSDDNNTGGIQEFRFEGNNGMARDCEVSARDSNLSFQLLGSGLTVRGCKAPDDGSAWGVFGSAQDAITADNEPAVDYHTGLSDGDSNGTISISLDRDYATERPVQIISGYGAISDISWVDSGSDGHYDRLDLSVSSGASGVGIAVQ